METLTWLLRSDVSPSSEACEASWQHVSLAFTRSHRRFHARWMVAPLAGASLVLVILLRPGLAVISTTLSLYEADRQLVSLEQDLSEDEALYQSETNILEGGQL